MAVPETLGYLFIGLVIFFVAGLLVLMKREIERGGRIQEAGKKLGFSYQKKAGEEVFGDTPIFKALFFKEASNLIEGKFNGREWKVFDFAYGFTGSKEKQRSRTTIVSTRARGSVPAFRLCPEGLLLKIFDKFTKQDIDFSEDLEFSKKYYLRGDNEKAVRTAFGPEVRRQIMKLSTKFCLESDGRAIFFYDSKKRISPENISVRIKEISDLMTLLDTGRR